MPDNFDDLLTGELPVEMPQVYHNLANGCREALLRANPGHTISLALLAGTTFFGTIILSFYMLSDPSRLAQPSQDSAFESKILNISCLLMILFAAGAVRRLLSESLTIYEFDERKLTICFPLAPRKNAELFYGQMKCVMAQGFMINGLSFGESSNVVIVTDERRYHLKDVPDSHWLLCALIARAAASQSRSRRTIVLTPQLDRYLTAHGMLPPV